MKIDVLGMPTVEGAEQIATELLAGRARQSLPPPDFAHAMHARIAAGVDRRQLFKQLRLLAQKRLDRRHFCRRQRLVEVGVQVGLSNARHYGSAYSSGKTSSDKSCL